MREYAQTYPQLMNQAIARGMDAGALSRLRHAHDLARRLFDGFYRAQGTPFVCHLIRTASIVLHENQPVEVLVAAMLHAPYMFGQFRDGGKGGMTLSHRDEIREAIGVESESLIALYQKLGWRNRDALKRCIDEIGSASTETHQVLLIRLANELEDHLDLAMVYRGAYPHAELVESMGELMVDLARRIGHPILSSELREAFQATATSRLPAAARYACRDAYELPEHGWLRLGPWGRMKKRIKRFLVKNGKNGK